jgi:hypothetical protein
MATTNPLSVVSEALAAHESAVMPKPISEPRIPRLTGAGGVTRGDLLSKNAGLRIASATAGGGCPAFMRTRYSGSTVPTAVGPHALGVAGGEEQGTTVQRVRDPFVVAARACRR